MDRTTTAAFILSALAIAALGGWIRPATDRAAPGPASSFAGPGVGVVASEVSGRAPETSARGAERGDGAKTPADDLPLDEDAVARLDAVRAAADDRSAEATALLLRALDRPTEHDDPAKLEAIDALVARHHLPALGRLLAIDPASDPYLGPTVLVGIGELGAAATDPAKRQAALDRLLSLLEQEKRRSGADSAGYVITIVEAIGALGEPRGATVLEKELVDPFHDTAGRAAIVGALEKIGGEHHAALTRLRSEVVASARDDDGRDRYQRALDRELLAAIDQALLAKR